ncbi:MAG TPA: tetratricopeptide repeat protein, partial [Planctomycetota bacterium]|nr:tetratricopeptide repeat protein [Planctomycetota bacterium]
MKARLSPFALAVALAGCIAAGFALQEGPRELGESALKDRDWAKASRLLTDALATAKEKQDEILLLLAAAQLHDGKHDAAIATLDRLLKDHAASPLKMKALYKKGDALAAKKEFALAAQIYDAQVAAITAPERRKRLAMIYVDAGREFLVAKDPKDPTFVADYLAAHKLLSKSLELEALGADEEGVRVDLVTCELKGGLPPPQLLKSCETFEEKYPKSARLDEVLFARGMGLGKVGRPWEAEKAWVRLAAEFAASKLAPEGLYLAARLHVTEQGNAADLEELRRALPLLRRLARDFAASDQGPKAAVLIGLALSLHEDLREEARLALTAFVDAQAKHERAPEALLRVADLWLQEPDDAKAIAVYEDFLKRFPDSALWPAVRQSIAAVRFDRLVRARTRKDWPGARTFAQEFVDLHATDGRSAEAAYEIGRSLKEEKKFKEAVEAWLKVAAKYPQQDAGHGARFHAAELMVSELDDFETALKELPKVGGAWGGHAAGLLMALQMPSLALASERVFKVGEAPTVKMTVRNVETVKLRFWTLDVKDYFEKKASTSGIQNLEVSVIAPDKEWEVPVKDYRRLKEFKLDVEVPKKDPGAYIVTASSGRLESTTVALVSDLAMIARAGRKGATVIVGNMKTGERVAAPALSTAADGKHLKAWTKESLVSKLS